MHSLADRKGTRLWFLIVAMPISAISGSRTIADDSKFPAPYDAEPGAAKVMSPQEALQSLKLPDGFHATLFAHEPDVQQPIALATDERGRLWVAECYTYAEGAKNFDTELRDRVVIFEDADGDGVHDRRTVFWDKGRKLTSVELGLGGVWVLCAPHLLFIPDRNRDDVPDGPAEIVLDGFKESAIRHNIVNGLRWGPDGWLYGRQGILETSRVGPPGASESQRIAVNCGVWRYHPIKKSVEAVLHGTTNPWGFDYDQHGEMFIINTVIGHLWHIVPGARTERMFGSDFNPRSYGLIGQVADHFHWDTREVWHAIRKGSSDSTKAAGGGHAHSGLMIYQGDNWPSEHRGKVFAINFHGRRLNQDRLERKGSGYVARHEQDMVFWQDPWFRGIDLASGPDGGVFVLDWSDTGECHEQDGIHRRSGRVYKITGPTPNPLPPFNLVDQPSVELANLQTHANDWWPRHARRVLRDRVAAGENVAGAADRLRQILADDRGPSVHRLRALWCLEAADALDDARLLELLSDSDEHVRVWAIRFLTDRQQVDRAPEPALLKQFLAAARDDRSGLVLLYLASALQRLPLADRASLAGVLAAREDFANDRTLALMIWYGLEPTLLANFDSTLKIFRSCQHPLIRQFIARRLAEEMESSPNLVDALLRESRDAPLRDAVMGMSQALRGWAKATPPAAWPRVAAELSKDSNPEIQQALLELGALFGEGQTVAHLRNLVETGSTDVRIRALRTLASTRSPDMLPLLHGLLGDRDLQVEAIRALSTYDDPETPSRLLDSWPQWSDEARDAIAETLSSRPEYAKKLLRSMQEGRVPRDSLSAFHARRIRAFADAETLALLSEIWGGVRETPEDRRQALLTHKAKLGDKERRSADLARGRRLYQKTCASCHVLFGEGRKLGPDLTGGNRKNLDYLLENIVDPSAVVAADFRASNVLLNDGRSLSGVVAATNERTLSLQTDREDVVLDRREIEEIVATQNSLMPDGLLKNLDDSQVRDLIAYLMGDGPVPLPSEAEGSPIAPGR